MRPDESVIQPRPVVLAVMTWGAALLRLAPHMVNVTPVGAVGLFGGAHFQKLGAAIVIPMAALLLSDLPTMRFHRLTPLVYGCFALNVLMGRWVRRQGRAWSAVIAGSLIGALVFYLISNFGMWASGLSIFPPTAAGLLQCYVVGLPLLGHTLAGDVGFAVALFGLVRLLEGRFPVLREAPAM